MDKILFKDYLIILIIQIPSCQYLIISKIRLLILSTNLIYNLKWGIFTSICFYNDIINLHVFVLSVEGIPIPEEEMDGYEWLQEIENPKDFVITAMMYNGPRVGI